MGIFNLFGKRKKLDIGVEYKFNDDENKAVFTCNHVLDEGIPVLHVSHDSDGDWQFLCGHNNHNVEDSRVISLLQAVKLDKTLNDLHEMPKGIGADRTEIGGAWVQVNISNE
ncbi:MAG: hypothetical protein ACPGLV_14075 [Bacteroidia bacterium]